LRSVPDETFGSMLRSRRFTANETQAQLASRLGTTQQTVGKWERGDRPQRRFLAPLAEYVGITGGAESLGRMLDEERAIRSGESARRSAAPSRPYVESQEPAAVVACAALVKAFSAKIELGSDLNEDEMDLLTRAFDALESHLQL